MANIYKILDPDGNEVNRIVADEVFVQEFYPGRFEYLGEQPEPEAYPSYRSIDKVEAMGLIRAVTGMSAAEELAFRDDPNLALFWRIWREDVGNVIWRDHPLTAQILDAIEAAGYLGTAQRQAVLDNWPTA
ncbi:hypothetical protein [Devosia sp. FJ2-5-3]|uniref:hypothetical protein n=1 Tax=Devosia sp. FJ2-5-3 TaxID=2976680 RepID=UPI0023D88DAD|nr:hypothetical protein [Devosia sp. FJ2-5-3]WEJ60244.1 hypothetical protein N0P34_09480 [Devosia sp. FJ2-5-3]